MRFLVAVRAAIADDQQSVVRVGGMAQGREYNAAGGDPRQDQGLDAVGAHIRSRSVPANALTRCLVTTISSASGATAGWIFAFSAPAASTPEALTPLNVAFRSLTSG